MTRQAKAIVGAVAGAFISILMIGFHLITLIIGAVVGWTFVAFLTKETTSKPKKAADDFSPDFSASTIAYDSSRRKLWTRPTRGPARVWDIGDIKSWDHTWTTFTNAFGKEFRKKNVMRFTTRDMKCPAFEVRMNTYEEGADWHARLTHWING